MQMICTVKRRRNSKNKYRKKSTQTKTINNETNHCGYETNKIEQSKILKNVTIYTK